MSLTQDATLHCPECTLPIPTTLWDSINADRRPDLRDAILDRSLHRFTCAVCESEVRVPPSLVYLDMGRKQVVFAHPVSDLGDWRGAVADARNLLQNGLSAVVSDDLTVRVVFGWAALREQVVVRDAGLDHLDVEVVKLAVMGTSPELTVEDDLELRLLFVDEGVWHLGWVRADMETPEAFVRVDADVLASIAPSAPAWSDVRAELQAELFMDATRMLVA